MTSFTTEMRRATKDIHALSDSLVNAKLFFALSSDHVWAQGLQVFYEIFSFLEESMNCHKKDRLGRFLIDGLERKRAFEDDIAHYLGADWAKDYEIKEEVAAYLVHLRKLEQENPDYLIAYVYHLYLGLLSGGQILQKKRQLKNKLLMRGDSATAGSAVTDFGELKISSIKKEIKEIMNEIAGEMDENERNQLLVESRNVFEWNNKVIRTIEGTDVVFWQKTALFIFVLILIYFSYKFLF